MGPPFLKAVKALEKFAIDQPKVCIMNTFLSPDFSPININETYSYFSKLGFINAERCEDIISKSGIGLDEYDFYFEWFREPTNIEFLEFIQGIDNTLKTIGVYYSLISRGSNSLELDLSQDEIMDFDADVSISSGYFEVYRDKGNQWRFRLKAPNHKIIAVSEAYTSKVGCLNGVKSVKENAANSEIYDFTE